MIDIHTHILPAIDDGAQTIQESVAMAQIVGEAAATAMVTAKPMAVINDEPIVAQAVDD